MAVQVLTQPLAEKLGLAGRSGVRITRVMGASASAAGLRVGDIVTKIDDDPVEASQPSDEDLFATMVRQYKIGSTVKLTVVRGSAEQQVAVKLDAVAAAAARDEEVRGPELRVPRPRHHRRRSVREVVDGRADGRARRGRP